MQSINQGLYNIFDETEKETNGGRIRMAENNGLIDSNFMLTDKGRQWIRNLLKNGDDILTIHKLLRHAIKTSTESVIADAKNFSTQPMPTRIEDIGEVLRSVIQLSAMISIKIHNDSNLIFDLLESVSLNQIELRSDLKETISAVAQKDEKERDKMLDYIERRMERDEKQIRDAVNESNKDAKLMKWIGRNLQDQAKVFGGKDEK